VTAGARLVALSGLSGVAASVMMAGIGAGATVSAALVSYSGLVSGTAAQHLLVDHSGAVGRDWLLRARRRGRR